MFDWIRDGVRAYRARKRFERARFEAAEQLLTESTPQVVQDDPDADDWRLIGTAGKLDAADMTGIRNRARDLVLRNPHAKNIIHLLKIYTVGAGMTFQVTPRDESVDPKRVAWAQRLWDEWAEANGWETRQAEFVERTWRDGECFSRLFAPVTWPGKLRFVDPELVDTPAGADAPAGGIETDPGDVESPRWYCVLAEPAGALQAKVPAERMLHTKIGVDGNVKRGLSVLYPVMDTLKSFGGWLETELIARKVAASVVLVRKTRGASPAELESFADAQATGTVRTPEGTMRRQKLRPGTIIDINENVDLEFAHPDLKFNDAWTLGRAILLATAAGVGMPEFMLTSDASNANYASTMVAEGPAVRAFEAWQRFFAAQWRRLWRRVMAEAVGLGLLDRADLEGLTLSVTPPNLIHRDRLKDMQANRIAVDLGAMSPQEVARRDGLDPARMRTELTEQPDPA